MSSGELVLRKSDGEEFLSYEKLEKYAKSQEQRANEERKRANVLAEKLRELGINPDDV